jgi:hypothetical protein
MMRTVFIALLTASTLVAQPSDSARADSAFRGRDWKATADLYGRIAAASPSQGMAWFRLGLARHALDDLDSAIAAYERALALQFQQPFTLYRLARAHASRKNLDRSFHYLDQLAPLNAVPLSIMDTASDLAIARRDVRWKGFVDRVNAARYPCRSMIEAGQFDFWLGSWDVTPWQAPPGSRPALLGTNTIEPILEHCVILENWTSAVGGSGKSMNFWDTNRRQWRQIWVADGGGSLDYAGSFREGAMRFEGWTLAPNGRRVLQKLTFFPISRDTVRQLFETSSDSGKTWQPGFDGRYVRKR